MSVFKPKPYKFPRKAKRTRRRTETMQPPDQAAPTEVADGQPAADELGEDSGGGDLLSPAEYDYSGKGNKVPRSERPIDDKRWMLLLALRVAAAAGVIALASSDLPYLLGITRRRRKRSQPVETADSGADKPV